LLFSWIRFVFLPSLQFKKQILGINAFTFVLAGLIAFFMTANAIWGPGWLGQNLLGIPGTGQFTEYNNSKGTPTEVLDLSSPQYRI